MGSNIELTRLSSAGTAASPRRRELEDVALQLGTLTQLRRLLESRDAAAEEVESHVAEIARLRARLARLGDPDEDELALSSAA